VHPTWSGCLLVFVDDAAQAVASMDGETRGRVRIADRVRK
jgi:hypothetical protein